MPDSHHCDSAAVPNRPRKGGWASDLQPGFVAALAAVVVGKSIKSAATRQQT